jgi:cytochrome c551/c552
LLSTGLVAALALGWSCSSSEAPSAAAGNGAAGQQLYAAKGCSLCHGPEGQGSMLGPALKDLKSHWDRARLAAFIADPNAVLKEDARLAQQAAKYPQPMAPLLNTSESDRLALADWLLR